MSGLTWMHLLGSGIGEGKEGGSWAYSVLDLELLASTDVARLGDGGLEAGEGLVVQSLFAPRSLALRSSQIPGPILPPDRDCRRT